MNLDIHLQSVEIQHQDFHCLLNSQFDVYSNIKKPESNMVAVRIYLMSEVT